MICPACSAVIRDPAMSLGSTWLYRCSCGKQEIRPAQQFRGAVTTHGITRSCLQATGLIENEEVPT